MSRLKTQSDVGSNSLRFNMILNNINRINNQNNKLQQLAFLTPQINQLRDVVTLANSNWEKIAVLAQKVHQVHQQAVNMRNMIHSALQKHGEQVNKSLMGEIQNCQIALMEHEKRLKENVSRQRGKSKIGDFNVRTKVTQAVTKLNQECLHLLQKSQKQYLAQQQAQVQYIRKHCQQQLIKRQHECKVGMGHLYNLTAYYHHQKHRQSLQEVSLAEMADANFRAIGKKLDTLDVKQKRVRNQIEWYKSIARRDRNKRQKEASICPQQLETIGDILTSLSYCEYQLKGLDRICANKSKKQNRLFTPDQIKALVRLKQRIVCLHSTTRDHSMFYKQSF